SNLASDAHAGCNRIEQATIAAAVSPGDLLLIRSEEEVYSGSGIYYGEMQTVLKTSGDYIYLSGALNDSYTTANNAKAAIVTPINFNVRGSLKIYQHPVSDSQVTNGIALYYCTKPTGHFEVYDCTKYALRFGSCLAPDVSFYTHTTHFDSTGTSYGLAISSATMDGHYRGTVAGARHAVSVGAEPFYPGISWNNHISCVGYGLDNAVFDAHEETGSVYFENCSAHAGTVYNKGSGTDIPGGFSIGAKYNYIHNCTYSGAASAVRVKQNANHVEVIEVDGLFATGNGTYLFKLQTGTTDISIDRLILRNIYGEIQNGVSLDSPSGRTTAINHIFMDNIHLNECRGLLYTGDATNLTLPSTITISNSSCVDSDNSGQGITIADSPAISNLVLNNVTLNGMTYPIYIGNSISRVELNDCRFLNASSSDHIYMAAGSITELAVNGGFFADCSNSLLRLAGTSTNCNKLLLNGTTLKDATAVVSCASGSSLSAAWIGPNDMPSVTAICNLYGANYLEYFAGGQNLPFLVRGSGSPEDVISAPVGSLFLRSDGSANTTLYIKESGSGNTGWVAK
ncbi:MAG: hypothetical protein P8X58_08675, partial [Syntrophobacterales bacterium]